MRLRLFRRNDIVSASDLSLSRWERLRRNFGAILSSVALASTFGLAAPGVAHAEEGIAETNDTPEMTYNMSNDEMAEISGDSVVEAPAETQEVSYETAEPTYEEGFSETVTADVTNYSEDTAAEASAEEQTVAESEQSQEATVEETSVSSESVTEESSSEISEVAVSPSTDSTVVVEKSLDDQGVTTENLSSGETQSSYHESSESSSSYEQSSSTISGGYEYEESEIVKEIKETREVQEINGKIFMFIKSDRVLSDEMLAQMVEDWRAEHFPNGGSPEVSIINISGYEAGRYNLEDADVDVIIDKMGNATIEKVVSSKTETSKPIATEEHTTTVDTSFEETVEGQVIGEAKTEVQEEKTSTQTQTETNSKTIAYNETDYVVVTGKDGSVTIVTKLPLSAAMGMKIKNGLINSGKMTNKSSVSFMTLKQNGETIIGNNVLTIGKDGSLGIIGSDFKDVEALTDTDVTNYLKDRIEKDENGHIDTEDVKPDHDVPTPPTPEPPTPEPPTPTPPTPEPPTPTPPTPTPPTPTPEPPTPTPPTPNVPTSNPNNLPKTGDETNPLAAGVVALGGVSTLAYGLKKRKNNGESKDDVDTDPILDDPEYQAEIARIDKAKHFTEDQKDRMKSEAYDEYSANYNKKSNRLFKFLGK